MIHTQRPPDNTQLLPPLHYTDPDCEGVQSNLQVLAIPRPRQKLTLSCQNQAGVEREPLHWQVQ